MIEKAEVLVDRKSIIYEYDIENHEIIVHTGIEVFYGSFNNRLVFTDCDPLRIRHFYQQSPGIDLHDHSKQCLAKVKFCKSKRCNPDPSLIKKQACTGQISYFKELKRDNV